MQETGLQIKEVVFNGDNLLGIQNEKGIFTGVKRVCECLGFSEGQRQRQTTNIQLDMVLKQGVANLQLPTNGGKQDVLCLMIDFLPLWLAKVKITPTMQRDNPLLVRKLIQYQLKAKDVLAKAFLSEQYMNSQFESRLNNLENQVLQLSSLVQGYQTEIINGQKLIYTSIRKALFTPVNTSAWKAEIYAIAKEIAHLKPDQYKSDRAVLSEFYRIMRDTYGFVEDQSLREYREKHNITVQVYTIDLIADNKQYREIFKNLLSDYLNTIKSTPIVTPIKQLVNQRSDGSPYGVQTYRFIYKNMMSSQAWKNRTTRYKNSTGLKNVTKAELVKSNEQLQRLFDKTVKDLIQDT